MLLIVAGLTTLAPYKANAWIRGLRPQLYDVPRQANVSIDGDTSEWVTPGFSVGPLAGKDGSTLPGEDFDVRARLGWSSKGLLFSIKLRDDISNEGPRDMITSFDSVSLRVADVSMPDRFVVVNIATGADSRFNGTRIDVDRRGPILLDIEAA
ncbi:MAG: hypothetical protein VX910_11055, partial [Candidatus Latescibacterota bacterium]|nr:hypothetical protein [Candidatus Latescibacterota bacterium]